MIKQSHEWQMAAKLARVQQVQDHSGHVRTGKQSVAHLQADMEYLAARSKAYDSFLRFKATPTPDSPELAQLQRLLVVSRALYDHTW